MPEDETEPLSAQDQQGFDFNATTNPPVKAPSPHAGHRDRLRERLLLAGGAALADHELLELLLFAAIPRRDTKPLAKELLAHFGSFERLITASPDELRTVLKNEIAIALIKGIEAAAGRLAAKRVESRDLIASNAALLDYCRTSLANQTVEQFRVLFLNTKNRLLKDVLMGQGTIDHAPVYVREIVAKALQLGAKSMILLHNHPGGDPTPSSADIAMTREIVTAAKPLGIAVHDHLVIGRNGHTSFRAAGLF